MQTRQKFAEALKKASKRYSLQEISDRSGVNISNLSKILNGKIAPNMDTMLSITNAIHMDLTLKKQKNMKEMTLEEIIEATNTELNEMNEPMWDDELEIVDAEGNYIDPEELVPGRYNADVTDGKVVISACLTTLMTIETCQVAELEKWAKESLNLTMLNYPYMNSFVINTFDKRKMKSEVKKAFPNAEVYFK